MLVIEWGISALFHQIDRVNRLSNSVGNSVVCDVMHLLYHSFSGFHFDCVRMLE